MSGMEIIGMGGGCHWCTEAVFQHLVGVERVRQGWAWSDALPESEAVEIMFDRRALPLRTLIEVHLRTHAATSAHSLRGKYRSAVYVTSDGQGEAARGILKGLQTEFDESLVTQVLPLSGFRENTPAFRDYYRTDPERPFCRTYIDPKLRAIRDRFGGNVVTE